MMDKTYSVLTVDDSAAMLGMLHACLAETEFEVVGQARDGADAVKQFRELKPDVTLLDIVMPGQSGIDTLSQIRASDPEAVVVMASSMGTEDAVHESLSRGASNFLQKPYEQESVLAVLRNTLKDK
jgi:two-component system, chemotaxis family, chemotaxis protein CheY